MRSTSLGLSGIYVEMEVELEGEGIGAMVVGEVDVCVCGAEVATVAVEGRLA